MRKRMIIGLLISAIFIAGCKLETPEIRGVVLDAETKEPVEGAWVRATIEMNTKTLAGDVNTVVSVEPPHTRTDKEGRFIIPSKEFKKPSFPAGFGTEVRSFGVSARTADWRGGGLEIKDKLGTSDKIDVTVSIRSVETYEEEQATAYIKEGVRRERALEIMEGERFSSLQALYNYCLTGRSSVETPAVEGGCDEWELDYAITKHERYLERYTVITYETKSHYSGILDQVSSLYKKKGDYKKALEAFKRAIKFIEQNYQDTRSGYTGQVIRGHEIQIKILEHWVLAESYEKGGDYRKAVAMLKEAIAWMDKAGLVSEGWEKQDRAPIKNKIKDIELKEQRK